MQKEQKPEVVILLQDEAEKVAISRELTKFGLRVIFEATFDSTWERLNTKTPQLFIVEVTSFSSGKRNFSTHPLIANSIFPTVIYYDQTTRPLVYTLPAIFTLGEIERTPNYEPVIKRICSRLEAISQKEKNIFEQNILIKKMEELNGDLFSKASQLESEKSIVEGLVKCCQSLIKAKADSQSFYDSLSAALENFPGVEAYSLVELGLDKSSLFAPKLDGGKCRPIKRISLPHLCPNGLTPFAQQIAIQAFSINGKSEIVSLSFYLDQANPHAMLLLTPIDRYDRQYIWDMLEDTLANFYWRSFSVREITTKSDCLNPGVFMEKAERENNNYRVVEIDMAKLLVLATDRNNGDVAWSNLHEDLITRFRSLWGLGAFYSVFGLDKMYIAIDRAEFEELFKKIQASANKFPYWKYFSKMNFDFSQGHLIDVREILANPQAFISRQLNSKLSFERTEKNDTEISFQLEN